MRNSILRPIAFILGFILLISCQLKSQTILYQSNDHVISYGFSGENIVITVEDINDNVNNVNGPYMWDQVPKGVYYGLYKDGGNNGLGTIKAESFCFAFDGSIIEFDSDLNGVLNKKDKGFFIQGNYKGNAAAHYLSDKFLDPYFRNDHFAGVVSNSISRASGTAEWITTAYSSKPHPVTTYTIPLNELVDFNTMQIKFRCIVIRAGGNPYSKPAINAKPTDTYYVYPIGQSIYYDNNVKFFTIDLTKSTSPVVLKAKKEYEEKKVNKKSSLTGANLLRKLYTAEALKKSMVVLPKYDNLFLKLKNGKFIEVTNQKIIHYGMLNNMHETYASIEGRRKNPFYLESSFDTLRFLQIEKSNLKGFTVVASSVLKNVVDYMTVHPIQKFPLLPLPGGNYKLEEKALNTDNNLTGGFIEGVNFYWFEPKIGITRTMGDGWSYNYTFNEPLEPGVYGFWAGNFIWLIEILPDPNSQTKVPSGEHYIGEEYGGGVVFYISDNGRHGLIAAKEDQPSSTWGCNNVNVYGTSAIIGSGKTNTTAIVQSCGNKIAARYCKDLVLNGFNDWYLPSVEELQLMYNQRNKIKMFLIKPYWSSSFNGFNTQFNAPYAWQIDFSNGTRNGELGAMENCVRAIRAF